jgi:hypothetical protein
MKITKSELINLDCNQNCASAELVLKSEDGQRRYRFRLVAASKRFSFASMELDKQRFDHDLSRRVWPNICDVSGGPRTTVFLLEAFSHLDKLRRECRAPKDRNREDF